MSTMTQPLLLAAARPSHPARRALLALAEALARVALHRSLGDGAFRAAAQAHRDRDALRLQSLTPPVR